MNPSTECSLLSYITDVLCDQSLSLREEFMKLAVRKVGQCLLKLHRKEKWAHGKIKPEYIGVHYSGSTGDVSNVELRMYPVIDPVVDSVKNTKRSSEAFVAPEARSRMLASTPVGDIWSLGMVLYCGIYLSFPADNFPGDDPYTFDGERVTAECRDLIRNMLRITTNKRITVQDILLHPWIRSPGYPERKCRILPRRFNSSY